ncbi:MAG: FkbM family methyltransferase [Bacteroidetes bacterium]|nr:FkbM family methyltransferase [Bacteroidota bacterium]
MIKKAKTLLFTKISQKGFIPNHVAELGVYHPETSNIIDYINLGIRTMLVEPDPKSINLITNYFLNFKNVKLFPFAIYDFNGELELVHREASTFVSSLPKSPALINDDYKIDKKDIFKVESKTFDQVDDSTIDLISIDIEGGEWFVLKYMKSKPTVISIETHGAVYINPFIKQINEWVISNNYKILYKDYTDTVFVNQNIEINLNDKLNLFIMDFYLSYRRVKIKIEKFVKSIIKKINS